MAARKGRAAPRSNALVLDDDDPLNQMERFVDLIADGTAELNAALEVGWTPKVLRSYLQDPDFRDLVEAARGRADGTIQQVLFDKAKQGNMSAIAMWLKSRQRDSWGDVQRHEVRGNIQHSVGEVNVVKNAVLAVLQQVGPAAMQALPAVIDAEVIDDGDEED